MDKQRIREELTIVSQLGAQADLDSALMVIERAAMNANSESVQALCEALRFYADPATYDANSELDKQCAGGIRPAVFLIDPIKNDKGQKARDALATYGR